MGAPYYSQESGMGGYYEPGSWPVSFGYWESMWDFGANRHLYWAEAGTEYAPRSDAYHVKRGFLKVPTSLSDHAANMSLYLLASSYSTNPEHTGSHDIYTGRRNGFQVFYAPWGLDIDGADWGLVGVAASAPVWGPIRMNGGPQVAIEVPLINLAQIQWTGTTHLIIRCMDEVTQPTELGTLNVTNFGSFFPNGLPCIGPSIGLSITPLSGGPASTRNGLPGVGQRSGMTR